MFVVLLTYKKPTEEVDSYLSSHVEYLQAQYSSGNFLASGRKIPRTGGVILSGVRKRQDLDEIIKQDPFYRHQIADYEVIEFSPSMTCAELESFKDQ